MTRTWSNWLTRMFKGAGRKPIRNAIRREPPRARLRIEGLEDRTVPANLTDGGTATLTIHLDSATEALGVVSNTTTYTFTTNSAFTDGGVADPTNDFDAFGLATITLKAPGLGRYD